MVCGGAVSGRCGVLSLWRTILAGFDIHGGGDGRIGAGEAGGWAFIWVAEVTEEYPEARFMARRMEIIPETADGQLLIHNIEIQNKKVIIQTKTELVEGEMIICDLS